MRILMINHFPLEGSGSGTYTKNLAMQLVECGYEVCVVAPENTLDFPQYKGVRIHPVYFTPENPVDNPPSPQQALPFNFPCFTTHPASTVAFSDLDDQQLAAYTSAFRAALEEEIEQFTPDIIHGQHVWILPALAADLGVPLVLTAHGTDLMGYDKWPDMRHYAETAMQACVKVICVSRDNERLVRDTFPDQADKIVAMSNGYNPAIFFPASVETSNVLAHYGLSYAGQSIVLFAGKLTNFKGVDVFLDAAALYESQLPNTMTLLAGDGELRTPLEEQAQHICEKWESAAPEVYAAIMEKLM